MFALLGTGTPQGAFIAGVQASVIAITSNKDNTTLGRATNWFAFVGLTLDLIGTSAGVARALLLQAAIRRSHRLVVRLAGQIDGARHQVRELQRRGVDLSAAPHAHASLTRSVRAISRVVSLLAEDGRFGVQSPDDITEIKAAGEAALEALGSGSGSGGQNYLIRILWLTNFILPHTHVEGLGGIPVLSLAGGTLCLLLSVILYAGNSQPRGVWISCSTIFVIMITCALFPTTNPHSRSLPVQTRVADWLIWVQSASVPFFTIASKRRYNNVLLSKPQCFQIQPDMSRRRT